MANEEMSVGYPLEFGVDAEGIRWFLDEKAVHSGTSLEILLDLVDTKWLLVRIEFDYYRKVAIIYWPVKDCVELKSELKGEIDRPLFRWPIKDSLP